MNQLISHALLITIVFGVVSTNEETVAQPFQALEFELRDGMGLGARIVDQGPLDLSPALNVIRFDTLTWPDGPLMGVESDGIIRSLFNGIEAELDITEVADGAEQGWFEFQDALNDLINGFTMIHWSKGHWRDAAPPEERFVDASWASQSERCLDGECEPALGLNDEYTSPVMPDYFLPVPFERASEGSFGGLIDGVRIHVDFNVGEQDIIDWPIGVVVVPEPSAFMLMILGGVAAASLACKRCR